MNSLLIISYFIKNLDINIKFEISTKILYAFIAIYYERSEFLHPPKCNPNAKSLRSYYVKFINYESFLPFYIIS